MQHSGQQDTLVIGDRCKVVGVASGFLLVLGVLAYLAATFAPPAFLLDGIAEGFRSEKPRRALGLGAVLLFYVAGLPAGIAGSCIAVVQGMRGRRTRLTTWILRESSQKEVRERHEEAMRALETRGELSPAEKMAQTYLPPALGWGLLLGFLLLVVGILVWTATRE
jgi:hypothetical protein